MLSQSMTKGWRQDINVERLGYFRTDDETVRSIQRLVKPSALSNDERIHLLDPCCGEGIAAQAVSTAWGQTTTWGIEYDAGRYQAAAVRLDHVLHGDALIDTYISSGWASAAFFNPPYGWEDAMNGGDRRRLESLFWKNYASRVMRGGLMIAVLPDSLFGHTPGFARAMSNYFAGEDVEIYRASVQKFSQIVIVGYRRRDLDAEPNTVLRDNLARLSTGGLDLPPIDEAPAGRFTVPAGTEPMHFETFNLTAESAAVLVANEPSSLIDDLERDLLAQRTATAIRRPMAHIRAGHIPQFLAAGLLDGFLADKDGQYLVKGSNHRAGISETVSEDCDTEDGVTTRTTNTTIYRWQTRILGWDLTPGRNFAQIVVD